MKTKKRCPVNLKTSNVDIYSKEFLEIANIECEALENCSRVSKGETGTGK